MMAFPSVSVRHDGSMRLEDTKNWKTRHGEQMWPSHQTSAVCGVRGVVGALRVRFGCWHQINTGPYPIGRSHSPPKPSLLKP